MTRGISDPAPVEEPKDKQEQGQQSQGGGPTNRDILDYLDELSDFIREIDIRLSTIERFAIKQIPENEAADKSAAKKNFLTGK